MHPAYVIEGLSQHGDLLDPVGGLPSSPSPTNPIKQDEDNKTLETSSISLVSESSSEGESSSNINDQAKVKFDVDASSTQIVRSRYEMDEEEFCSIWYNRSDFAEMSSWNRMTVRIYRQHIRECTIHTQDELLKDLDLDAEGYQCIRGLEHRLKGEQSKRTEMKTNAIYSVLGQQAKFKREKLPVDPVKLALVYKEHTYANVANAVQTGSRDERIAREVHALPTETEKDQEEKASNETRVSRKSGLIRALDDSDLNELQYDDDEDNSSEGECVEEIASAETIQPKKQDYDEDSFRAKARREVKGLSFSRFFFKSKKKKKSSTKSSKKKHQKKHQQNQEQQQQEAPPVVVRRKQARRSSM